MANFHKPELPVSVADFVPAGEANIGGVIYFGRCNLARRT